MRRETTIAGLLCLNLVLAASLAFVWRHRATRLESPAPTVANPAPVAKTTARLAQSGDQPFLATSSNFSWRVLESADYKQYIANLRAVGCPEQTVQDIIIAAVTKQYAAREVALNLRPAQAKPWEVAGWSG